MSHQHVLNQDGKCYSFDHRGTGYGRGEGAGMVLLKRLDEALRDGDDIKAVIKASAVNQDGKTNGLALPNQLAQESLARKAFRGLDFTPGDVHFLEAHATGTVAGDQAEVGAIHNVYCRPYSRATPLVVGSVKANIGHLESASGVAGLIKAIMCMKHASIPPNLLFEKAKKDLFLEEKGIKVSLCVRPLGPCFNSAADTPYHGALADNIWSTTFCSQQLRLRGYKCYCGTGKPTSHYSQGSGCIHFHLPGWTLFVQVLGEVERCTGWIPV